MCLPGGETSPTPRVGCPSPVKPELRQSWGKISPLGYHEICISCRLWGGQATLSLGILGVSCGITCAQRGTLTMGGNLINVVYLSPVSV